MLSKQASATRRRLNELRMSEMKRKAVINSLVWIGSINSFSLSNTQRSTANNETRTEGGEPDLVIFLCPRMRLVPKSSKFDGLSYETC
jgi:hypothetical protein